MLWNGFLRIKLITCGHPGMCQQVCTFNPPLPSNNCLLRAQHSLGHADTQNYNQTRHWAVHLKSSAPVGSPHPLTSQSLLPDVTERALTPALKANTHIPSMKWGQRSDRALPTNYFSSCRTVRGGLLTRGWRRRRRGRWTAASSHDRSSKINWRKRKDIWSMYLHFLLFSWFGNSAVTASIVITMQPFLLLNNSSGFRRIVFLT